MLDTADEVLIRKAITAPNFDGNTKRLAELVAAAGDDPLEQLKVLRQTTQGTRFQMAQAAYYNSLLSGVKTHLRNFIGNSFNLAANLLTPVVAGPIDLAVSKATGRARSVYAGEVLPEIVGVLGGLRQAMKDAVFTMRHGFTPGAVGRASAGKFDAPRVELPGGAWTNWPGRALEAGDVLFRSLARNAELHAGAYALARSEGKRGSALTKRMAELIGGTGDQAAALHEAAETFAARAVFQEDSGPIVRRLLALKSDPSIPVPFRAAMTFVAPFVRTPSNILRQGAEFGPLGFAMRAGRQSGRAGAQAQGRAALGTVALAPLAYLAATGRLSGAGPSNQGERAALMEKGWRPNSVKVGETWVSYNLFQPMSVALAAIGNAWERFSDSDHSDAAAEESFAAAVSGVGASFLDQSFLAGLSTLLNAIDSPDRYGKGLVRSMSQSLTPGSGILRNVTQAVDPVVRKPEGAVEAVKSIIPGLSQTVPPRLDRFGQPVERPGGPIRRGFTVPELSEEVSKPEAALLERLGLTPQVPRGDLVLDGARVELTREQSQVLREARGKARAAVLRRFASLGSRFSRQPVEAQRAAVERELTKAARTVTQRAQTLTRRRRELTVPLLLAGRE